MNNNDKITAPLQLGWIDFSAQDREKAMNVLRLGQEKGALDELGIGTIRDGFANFFFPGTSTIQTRAKYFVLIPYILRQVFITTKAQTVEHVLREIDEKERYIAQQLGNHEGVIGRDRIRIGKWVVRPPVSIYWQGLKTFKLFDSNESTLPEAISHILTEKQKRKNTSTIKQRQIDNDCHDDDDAGKSGYIDPLHVTTTLFALLPTDWQERPSIELTHDEAQLLRYQIINCVDKSLLAIIMKYNINIQQYSSFDNFAEAMIQNNTISNDVTGALHMAICFKNFMKPIFIRYNVLMSDFQNQNFLNDWENIVTKLPELANFQFEPIFCFLKIKDNMQKHFLYEIQDAMKRSDLERFDKIITNRERRKNPAKLQNKSKYYKGEWIGMRTLDYRFADVQKIVSDIFNAL